MLMVCSAFKALFVFITLLFLDLPVVLGLPNPPTRIILISFYILKLKHARTYLGVYDYTLGFMIHQATLEAVET